MRIALWIAAVLCAAAAPSRADLVGYWSFDEGAGQVVADGSGNGNHGVLGGSAAVEATDPTWTTRPGGGNALSFDDTNDAVRVADPGVSSLDVGSVAGTSDALTISAWVSPVTTSGHNAIVVKGPSAGGGNHLPGNYEFRISSSRLVFLFQPNGGTGVSSGQSSPITFSSGTWTHVAVVLEEHGPGNTTFQFYVNGSPFGSPFVFTSGFAAFGTTNDQPLLIGNRADGVTPFSGGIDDVAIWNHALHPLEIGLLASGRSPLALPEPASITALAVATGLAGRRSRRPNRG